MQWLSKDDLETELVELIGDVEYKNFVNAMERLSSLPYSYRIKDFILKYRKPLQTHAMAYEVVKPKYDADGRMYVTTYGTVFSPALFLRGRAIRMSAWSPLEITPLMWTSLMHGP